MNQSVRNAFKLLLASLQYWSTEANRVCQDYWRLLQFSQISYKLQTMAKSSNKLTALDQPIKKFSQEQQNKKTRAKLNETLWRQVYDVMT